MSTAIFLTPRGNGGGYDIQVGEDYTSRPHGGANLVIFDNHGDSRIASLGEGDWVQLRDRIDQMLNNR